MGIKSAENWSGIVVNGVTLGEPAVHEDGTFEWDGGVPEGELDNDLMFVPAGADEQGAPLPSVSLQEMSTVKIAEWRQPEGAHDAYPEKAIVEDADGVFWVSLIPANVWAPGVSGWRRISTAANEVFPWVQPTGAHDAYKLGAKVTYQGFTWENTGSNANVWAPGVFGWVKV